jgi:endonuclease G
VVRTQSETHLPDFNWRAAARTGSVFLKATMKKTTRDNLLLLAMFSVLFAAAGIVQSRINESCAAAGGISAGDIKTSPAPPVAAFCKADDTEEDDAPEAPVVGHVYPLERFAPTKDYTVEPYGLVSYDTGLRTPRWVLHEITEQSVDPTGPAVRPKSFHADESIDDRWRTHPGWFANSGFDLGHCAPCADFKYSQKITDATMSLKNIMVQSSYLNEHPWAQLESSIRKLAQDGDTVIIVTGPAWKSEGKPTVNAKVVHGMVAGTHVFKAALLQGTRTKCFAWLAPNNDKAGTMADWQVTTDELEEVVGFDLWPAPPGLDDEAKMKWNAAQEKLESRK